MSPTASALSLADFRPLLGETFRLRADVGACDVQLAALRSLGFNTPAATGGAESFALEFVAPAGLQIPQGVFTLSHARLGELAIFLVPIARDAGGLRLEAIFNFA